MRCFAGMYCASYMTELSVVLCLCEFLITKQVSVSSSTFLRFFHSLNQRKGCSVHLATWGTSKDSSRFHLRANMNALFLNRISCTTILACAWVWIGTHIVSSMLNLAHYAVSESSITIFYEMPPALLACESNIIVLPCFGRGESIAQFNDLLLQSVRLIAPNNMLPPFERLQ